MFKNTTTTSLKKTRKMTCKRTYPSPPQIYSKPLNQNTDPNRKRRRRTTSGFQKKLAQPKTEQASFLRFLTSQKRKERRESASPPRFFPFPQLRHCSPILSSTTTTPKIQSCENKRRHNNRTEKKKCRAKKIYDNNNFMIISTNSRDFGSLGERFWQRGRSSGRRRWCKGRPHSSYSSLTLV
jgi:hypothetical protein